MSDAIINLDDSVENADWTKTTWDLPPYQSAAFFAIVPYDQLNTFRNTPVYKNAVKQGLIHDDEWVADYAKPTPSDTDNLADAFLSALAHAQSSDKK